MREVLIYGEIGTEVTELSIAEQLANAGGDPVLVRVSSGGGDVYAGIGILNALRGYSGEITVVVDSLAASAASFIAVGAGGRVIIRPTAEIMVHRAWAMPVGNAEELARTVVDLERQDMKLANIYADKAGGNPERWLAAMSAETWFSAEEALAAGLVDAVEDARATVKPAALGRSKVMARFRFNGRREAPAPDINRPSGQKGEGMSFLNELAQTLGKSEDQVLAALGRIMNEEVTVTSTVEVEYPEGTTVVPTGKATIEPTGDLPPGLIFAVGEVPEGWSAEVDETTGVLTVTAPAEAEPDAEVSIPVTVSGDGDPVEMEVVVAVKAAADDDEAPAESAPAAPPAGPETVTLDRDTYNDLVAGARLGWEAKAKAESDSRRKQVDTWIREGRINAAHRAKVIKAMDRDETAARELYGSIPKNTIPVREIGHGIAEEESDGVPTAESLRALSASRKSGK
ncbi:MAG TPA: ATP-dependent Clp protease proteolytic subunit [Corynebacterium pollutisoli]|nr:ATP-dependent Clp protease proteolytic subunit [Corynebacterium pollutisoli]